MIKRIGVITSGGDAPGMNAAIRAVVREGIRNGLEVFGVERGYIGLLEGQVSPLNLRSVSNIIGHGGTFLKTGRCKEIRTPEGIRKAVSVLKQHQIDSLVVIGGDGSMRAGEKLSKQGISVIGVPGSIDNDVYGTDETIGYDSAIDTAIDAVDRIRDTAASHERIFIIEVMGREHGFLALAIAIAAGAEFVLVPEIKYDIKKFCKDLRAEQLKGKTSIIVIFAEGVGKSFEYAEKIKKTINTEVRLTSLGYIQRGGSPSARSRILASLFGVRAVELLLQGKKNRLVAIRENKITDVPFSLVKNNEKKIDMDLYRLVRKLAT